jgi:hypothetical protein
MFWDEKILFWAMTKSAGSIMWGCAISVLFYVMGFLSGLLFTGFSG